MENSSKAKTVTEPPVWLTPLDTVALRLPFTLHLHTVPWVFCWVLYWISGAWHRAVLEFEFYSMWLRVLLSLWEGSCSCAKSLVRFELKPPSLEPWLFHCPLCPCSLHRSCDGFELGGTTGKLCWFTVEIKANQNMWLMICNHHRGLIDVQGLYSSRWPTQFSSIPLPLWHTDISHLHIKYLRSFLASWDGKLWMLKFGIILKRSMGIQCVM